MTCHGSSWVAFRDRETRSRSKINVKNLDGDFLANLDNLGRVVNVLPGQLGDVNQTVHATQIDEGTEVDDGGHDTLADLALLELVAGSRSEPRTGSAQAMHGGTEQHCCGSCPAR